MAKAEPIEKGDLDYDRLWAVTNQNNGNRYNRYPLRTEEALERLGY